MVRRRDERQVQFFTSSGWALVHNLQINGAYEVLFRGQVVGWVAPAEDGWMWMQAETRIRKGRSRYRNAQLAAGALSRTGWARTIAGRLSPAVRVDDWRQSPAEVWTPAETQRDEEA